MYKEASKANKLLVISRANNQKVLPWIVSPTGAIRCFDTVSLSQKFSLHRHAKVPIVIHLFLWDRTSTSLIEVRATGPVAVTEDSKESTDDSAEGSDNRLVNRDTAAESSFRFHNFTGPYNWV